MSVRTATARGADVWACTAAKKPSISVFFPAFNDAPSLPGLVEKSFAVLEKNADDYEVIVVNDGSRDDTAEVLAGLADRFAPRLRVVTQ